MKRYLAAILVAVHAVCLVGCSRAPATPAPAANVATATGGATRPDRVTVQDGLGRTISIPVAPRRLITWGPGATEIVYALGLGNRLVGRDKGSDYPAAALKVPVVADYAQLSYEQAIAARPDLIIAQGETLDRQRMENWQRQTGTPVVAFPAQTVLQVARDIEILGRWLGAPAPALRIARELAAASGPATGKSVFIEVQRSPLWAVGRQTLLADVLARAGLLNAAADVAGYKPYNVEALIARRPDYYLLTAPGNGNASRDALRRHPQLKHVPCVRDGRILTVSPDLLLRPGPRLKDGILALVRAVTPGPFPTTSKSPSPTALPAAALQAN